MAGNTYTSDDLLNLRGVHQRIDSYAFDLIDGSLNVIGSVNPVRDHVPTITLDTTRGIHRTLTGFVVDASRQSDIATVSARVRPRLTLQNGASYNLGVFLFGDGTRPRRSWGLELNASLVDALFILAQPVGRIIGYPAGTNLTTAALTLAQEVITSPSSVVASGATTGVDKAYRASDSRQKIINDLLGLASYLPVFFDNDGVMVMTPVPTLPAVSADFTYEAGGRIIKDSIIETDDLLTAPNRWVVVDTGATQSAIVGSYDLPASAPNSISQRGFAVVHVIEQQGLGNVAAANAAAQAYANTTDAAFKQVTFESTHDPRHDAFNIVQFLGSQYRELGWSIDLRSGARMKHVLRRIYS